MVGTPLKPSVTAQTSEYLRIHIRANSDNPTDQEMKYLVRAVIAEYLTPVVAGCNGKHEAEQ